MYMERAGKEDKEMAERWKSDADSILVFVSFLFATYAHGARHLTATTEWIVLCYSGNSN
jgi:hypothetical protein